MKIYIRFFVISILVLGISNSVKAEPHSAYTAGFNTQNMQSACLHMIKYQDSEACYEALNRTSQPQKFNCGPINIGSIMQGAVDNKLPEHQIGAIWRHMASLVLEQCNYNDDAKRLFLEIEEKMMGPDGRRKRIAALAAERRSKCILENHNFNLANPNAANIAFYSYVGKVKFGGGPSGDRQAIKYLEGLSSAGRHEEINILIAQWTASQCP